MQKAILPDGEDLARRKRGELQAAANRLTQQGSLSTLAMVLVGDDPASRSYVARKHTDCQEVGIDARQIELPAHITRDELLSVVDQLNADTSVHGLLVQFPLPEDLDEHFFAARISP